MTQAEAMRIAKQIWPDRKITVQIEPLFGNHDIQRENDHWRGCVYEKWSQAFACHNWPLLVTGWIKGKYEAQDYLVELLKDLAFRSAILRKGENMDDNDKGALAGAEKMLAASHQIKRIKTLEQNFNRGASSFEISFKYGGDSVGTNTERFSLSAEDGKTVVLNTIKTLREKYEAEFQEAKQTCASYSATNR